MNFDSISGLKLLRKHEANHVFSGRYNEEEVIVKIPTKAGLVPFVREFSVLSKLKHRNIINLIGWGDTDLVTPNGKFLVLEKVNTSWPIKEINVVSVINDLVNVQWFLSGYNFYWLCILKHTGIGEGRLKIFDFNDHTPEEDGFLNFRFEDLFQNQKVFNTVRIVKELLKVYDIDPEESSFYIDKALRNLIISEYQSLENVHEEIPVDGLRDTLRRESERDDPNCGKLVPANRLCKDRLEMLLSYHSKEWWKGKAVLDIGCNIGWFCFELNKLGAGCCGIEVDKRKARFAKLLSWWQKRKNLKFIDEMLTPESQIEPCDVILAFSVLHRLEGISFKSFNYGSVYLRKMIEFLWSKTVCDLVIELPVPFIHSHFDNNFVSYLEGLGARVKILGKSDNKRDLYCCSR